MFNFVTPFPCIMSLGKRNYASLTPFCMYGGEIGAAVVHLERVAIAVDEMQQASGVAGRKA